MKPIFFTKQGYEKVKKEFDTLKQNRVEFVAELRRAREMGDLSENAAYKVARQRLTQTDSRLRWLTLMIRIGKVIEHPFTGVVDFGTQVTVKNKNEEFSYIIAGDQEANPATGRISPYSPIGKAIFGKRKGDTVSVVVPSGIIEYTIVDIKPLH
jgi:transcription elongation factor GreA